MLKVLGGRVALLTCRLLGLLPLQPGVGRSLTCWLLSLLGQWLPHGTLQQGSVFQAFSFSVELQGRQEPRPSSASLCLSSALKCCKDPRMSGKPGEAF